jgi:hypothetical protein
VPTEGSNQQRKGWLSQDTPRKIYGLPEEKLDSPPARKAVEMTA